jgi:uncharacterized glyoxalase superfamily protein PhnB
MTSVSMLMVSIMVPDMDDAISHYTRDWGFCLIDDSHHASGHRWVEISVSAGAKLRLVEASNDEQRAVIGRQVADRVGFFLYLTDFDRTVDRWISNGIQVAEPMRSESYGRVIVVTDKYGNKWDAIEPT